MGAFRTVYDAPKRAVRFPEVFAATATEQGDRLLAVTQIYVVLECLPAVCCPREILLPWFLLF